MSNNGNGNRPLEDEFRSSQVYRALNEVGIPVAQKITQGIGKAAEEIANALGDYSQREKQNASQAAPPYQPARQRPAAPQPQAPRPQPQTPQRQTARRQSYPGAPVPGQPPQYSQPSSRQPAGVNRVPAPQMPQTKMVRRGSPIKYYMAAAAAILYALNGPLYDLAHLVILGGVVALAFFLGRSLFKGKKEFVPIEPAKPQAPPKKEEKKPEPKHSTGDPEVDKLIDDGKEYLKKLRAANDAIPDEALTEDITRMEKASADIFRFITDHPEKAPQIRKFMNYYLPTTLKLLNSYQRLASQSVRGENITSTMFNIAGMMHTVADAFEKQLDSLFTDEAMDVSADITVFETLLKQEGFVDEKAETNVRR